ncbi:MAG TPA: winged helix-turn-helix domain-containing protein [Thermoanaerobaculia bacterium]|jgi:DNA-binding winged helix-turn-helix (wHTH) protein|nr:winged helix-turn-helix domain-containing protein [Thermoanaerobaculia bacterium]
MSDRYRFGPFELDATEHSLLTHGKPVALTRRAFDTLLYLVRHPGRLVTRDELIAAVWGETIVEEGNLHWTISAVRKALAQEFAETWIETVRGLGYRFLGTVEAAEEDAEDAVPESLPPTAPVLAVPGRRPRRLWLAAGLGAVLLATAGVWIAGRPADRSADRSNTAPEAQRLYAEGLERLQRRDGLNAVDRLEGAVRADPGFPAAWLALAEAYELLGAERRAEDAALKAVQRSNGLPEPRRLTAEATYLRIAHRLPEAADRIRRAYELSRHAFEAGLALCETQAKAGQGREALATLAELRREHPAESGDARLALFEAEAYAVLEDYRGEKGAAERAFAAARSRGMVQVEARALLLLALARLRAGSAAADCRPALADLALARRQAEATGDRFLLGSVLQSLGRVLSQCEDPAGSEQAYRQAIDLYREIGALSMLPALLYSLGGRRLYVGDLFGADSLMREALDSCEAQTTPCRERFLTAVGANRLHRGELAEARRMIDQGIQRNLKIGNRNRVAEARGFLPDLAFWSGDLEQAVELQRQVLALRQEIGTAGGIAWARSDLANWLAEAGHGAEALQSARLAVAMASRQGDPSLNACSRASLALSDLVAGDLAAADRESARALAILHPPGQPFCSFTVWRVRTQVLLARGQLDAAEALIDQGLELARRGGFVTYELQGRLLQAELTLARGRSGEARQLAAELAAEARAKGFGIIAQRCALLIAQARGPVVRG